MKSIVIKELIKDILKCILALCLLALVFAGSFIDYNLASTHELTPKFVNNMLLVHWVLASIAVPLVIWLSECIISVATDIRFLDVADEIDRHNAEKLQKK